MQSSTQDRTLSWQSTICQCYVLTQVSKGRKFYYQPCDIEHTIWCIRVGKEILCKRISELTKVTDHEIEKMKELLVWKYDGIFMRPTFKQEHNGLFSYQCFWDWDVKGVSLPEGLEDPEILSDLVQSKKNREFTIKQWTETYQKRDIYPIWPEEYFEHPGMTFELFEKLFGRKPNEIILKGLQSTEGL